jgi:PAS domain S-box-containing protein
MCARKRSAEDLRHEVRRMASRFKGAPHPAELVHELRVYQEELVAQNEVLRQAQSELEEVRDRFIELYDFAPNGYLTLDEHGVILRINLTGASWLGQGKAALEGMPLLGHLDTADRRSFFNFMRQCRNHKETTPLSADVRIRNGDGTRDVQLLCRPRARSVHREREFFTAMIDMTERRRLEAERAHALQQRAELPGRIISIQEEERQRIARDLHDNIGQQVTALRLKLETLEVVLGSNPEARARLAEAESLGQTLDRALDFIATELRPAVLDLGFIKALEQFTAQWSRNFGIAVRLNVRPIANVRMPPDTEAHLYRVTQEALHNVYKHARAHAVTITLEGRASRLRLTIEDDGIGAAADAVSTRRGFGLVNMRERVQLLGGTIEFQRGPSGGMKVVAEVPNVPAKAGAHTW